MGMIKNYLLRIQERVSEHAFGQEAVEHGIHTGALKITYDLEADTKRACEAYDRLCEDYRDFVQNGPRPIEVDFFKVEGFHMDATVPQPMPDERRRLTVVSK